MELRPGIFFKENEIQIQGHGKESLQQTNSLPNSSEGETSSQHWQRHPLQEYNHHHHHHRHCRHHHHHQHNHHHYIIIITIIIIVSIIVIVITIIKVTTIITSSSSSPAGGNIMGLAGATWTCVSSKSHCEATWEVLFITNTWFFVIPGKWWSRWCTTNNWFTVSNLRGISDDQGCIPNKKIWWMIIMFIWNQRWS